MTEGVKIRHLYLILFTLYLVAPNTVHADICSISYTYDLVGNRLERQITANGQILTTEYTYDDANDCLLTETHTVPVAMIPFGNERFYAYSNTSKLNYKSAAGTNIGKVQAFILGLPNKLAVYVFFAILILLPISFFTPGLAAYIKRFRRPPPTVKTALTFIRAFGSLGLIGFDLGLFGFVLA